MYSPKTIMSGDTLNYKIPLYHKIDQYYQVQEEDTPRKSQANSVKTTSFERAGHAVETMDTASDTPALLSEDIP